MASQIDRPSKAIEFDVPTLNRDSKRHAVVVSHRTREWLAEMPLPGGGDKAAWLASQLNISRTQVFRKLASGSWDLDDELPRVAQLLGHSMAELFVEMACDLPEGLHGLITVDGTVCRCSFTVATPQMLSIGLHAIQTADGWRVSAAPKPEGTGHGALPVATLVVTGAAGPRKRLVVIIDDDPSLAKRLAAQLESNGYGVMLFANAVELANHLQWFEAVDAFLISIAGKPEGMNDLVTTISHSRHDKAVVCFQLEHDTLEALDLNKVILSPLVHVLEKPADGMEIVGLLDSVLYA